MASPSPLPVSLPPILHPVPVPPVPTLALPLVHETTLPRALRLVTASITMWFKPSSTELHNWVT